MLQPERVRFVGWVRRIGAKKVGRWAPITVPLEFNTDAWYVFAKRGLWDAIQECSTPGYSTLILEVGEQPWQRTSTS